MKIFYPKDHKLHHPDKILDGWDLIPAFEIPERADRILEHLNDFEQIESDEYSKETVKFIKKVHSREYFNFLSEIFDKWSLTEHNAVIPYNFTRTKKKYLKNLGTVSKVALYAFDLCTPIYKDTFTAAMNSAECSLKGAKEILSGEKRVYSLSRPPGHHAGKESYGGFCYINNSAVAAKYLLDSGKDKISILDLDYHHGNGTQDIFYRSDKVQYISLHATPEFDYPYSWGAEDETGTGKGEGFNINYPLPLRTEETEYLKTLDKAVSYISNFNPDVLIISLGTDIHKNDPLGSFILDQDSFSKIAQRFKDFDKPIFVIQEGGYNLIVIGSCVKNFLKNL